MELSFLDRFLWTAGFVGHLILLVVLLCRRRIREVPVFSVLIADNVLRTAVLYAVRIHGSAWAYFYSYWSLTAVDMVLYLAVFVESAQYTYRASDFRARPSRLIIGTFAAVGLGIAGIVAWLAPMPGTGFLNPVILRGNLVASLLLSELFAAMVVSSGRAGIPWRTHPARVLQGLGVYALAGLLIHAAQGLFGIDKRPTLYKELSNVEMFVYLGCLGYWIITLYRDAPQRFMSDEMRKQLTELSAEAGRAAQNMRLSE